MGYDKYSIVGFSEGSRIALLMAAKYPESILNLVLSAIKTVPSSKGLSALPIEKWREDSLKDYLKVYETKDEIQKLWNRFVKFEEFYSQYFPEDIYKGKYRLVTCPVLLTHGDKVCNKTIVTEFEAYIICLRNSIYLVDFSSKIIIFLLIVFDLGHVNSSGTSFIFRETVAKRSASSVPFW